MKRSGDIILEKHTLLSQGECSFEEIKSGEKILEHYSQKQQKAISLRGCVVEWLFSINTKLEDFCKTFFSSIFIFDYFISRSDFVLDNTNIQLFSAVCYFICNKFEEVNQINLEFVQNSILMGKFSAEEIAKAEITILKKINFRVYFPTVQTFSEIIFEKLRIFYGNEKVIQKLRQTNLFVNYVALLVEDLVFNRSTSEMSIITFKTSLLLLLHNRLITQEAIVDIKQILAKEFSLFSLREDEINETSYLLFQIILDEDKSAQKNIFMPLYDLVRA
jgi:hypothetical protein